MNIMPPEATPTVKHFNSLSSVILTWRRWILQKWEGHKLHVMWGPEILCDNRKTKIM
jgi:hypothetical protein